MDLRDLEQQFESGQPSAAGTAEPGPRHDAAVLEAARAAGHRLRERGRRRQRLRVPLALAAGLALGVFLPAVGGRI